MFLHFPHFLHNRRWVRFPMSALEVYRIQDLDFFPQCSHRSRLTIEFQENHEAWRLIYWICSGRGKRSRTSYRIFISDSDLFVSNNAHTNSANKHYENLRFLSEILRKSIWNLLVQKNRLLISIVLWKSCNLICRAESFLIIFHYFWINLSFWLLVFAPLGLIIYRSNYIFISLIN